MSIPMQQPADAVRPITPTEFKRFQRFIYDAAGIAMADQKMHLVAGRLQKRLRHHGLRTYSAYFDLVNKSGMATEKTLLVDLLTTNETYFFREIEHFHFLAREVLPAFKGKQLRIWSAACSSGEEVYSLAMTCADALGQGDWEVHGSDISQSVLEKAAQAIYPMSRIEGIPKASLRKYCLKGVRSADGSFLIDPRLKEHTRFRQINLKNRIGIQNRYQVIFLRNVMIYFDMPTKKGILEQMVRALQPGGYLLVSHVESLHGVTDALHMLKPSVFRKPG